MGSSSKTCLFFLLMAAGPMCLGAAPKSSSTFVLEDVRIEGKIRRPQLVLIKADQRPAFEPMAMQSFGKNFNIVEAVDQTVIEECPYRNAFKFEDKAISNCVP